MRWPVRQTLVWLTLTVAHDASGDSHHHSSAAQEAYTENSSQVAILKSHECSNSVNTADLHNIQLFQLQKITIILYVFLQKPFY